MASIYEVKIVFSKEDAPELLIKHGFVKVKRHWELKSSLGSKFSTQDALQAISLSIIHDAIRVKK